MGACFSFLVQLCAPCCRNSGASSQYGDSVESLLGDSPEDGNAANAQRQSDDVSNKSEEQSDFNKILEEMARNFIDVASLGSHTLEPHVYKERLNFYASRLRSPALTKAFSQVPKDCLLMDLPNPERILTMPSRVSDIQIVSASMLLDEVDTMFEEFEIEHPKSITVPFHVKRN